LSVVTYVLVLGSLMMQPLVAGTVGVVIVFAPAWRTMRCTSPFADDDDSVIGPMVRPPVGASLIVPTI